MDLVQFGPHVQRSTPTVLSALVRDVPDAASVAILASLVGRQGGRAFEQAVRARYQELTQPGEPDGPR